METSAKDELRRGPAYQMWLLTNAWQRMLRQALEPFALTQTQFNVLASIVRLREAGKSVTQAEVCRFGSLDPNVVSAGVRSLLDLGLVAREPHRKDQRAYSLRPTPEGERLYAEARAVVLPMSERFYAPLGDRLEEFSRMLKTLNDAQLESEHDESR